MQEGPCTEISPDLLGDVVISVETAHRHAREASLSVHSVLTKLLVHGVLHLLGYDHERSEAQARQMEAKEEEILQALRTESPVPEP
jgi:probable rRNA maturation factor